MSEENRTDQRKTREMLHYDEICKHLLSYKPILARILKECVEEYHDLSYEAIQACIEPDLKGAQHGFEHSSYGEIKKVHTIWLCFGHAKKKADYDVLEVVMVYPGTKRREEENGMMGLLKELVCEGGEEKGKRLAEKYGILMTKEMEVDRMCDLSQIFIDKGMEKGLLLGESKGKEESNVACVRSLSKHLSINYEEAMDLLEIEKALRPSILERMDRE